MANNRRYPYEENDRHHPYKANIRRHPYKANDRCYPSIRQTRVCYLNFLETSPLPPRPILLMSRHPVGGDGLGGPNLTSRDAVSEEAHLIPDGKDTLN